MGAVQLCARGRLLDFTCKARCKLNSMCVTAWSPSKHRERRKAEKEEARRKAAEEAAAAKVGKGA